MQPVWHPSPNCSERRLGATPDLIVLHYTAMNSAEAALDRLCDPAFEVSAHYLISSAGVVYQMVDETQRAWHAGVGSWGACQDVNSRSIGIELANDGRTPFAAAQMNALGQLIEIIRTRWPIPLERLIGHSDLAPDRKSDPGRRFDWRRLALQGLSVWPTKAPAVNVDRDAFRRHATAFGYSSAIEDAVLLDAVRQRFRPWAVGALDKTDIAVVADLARRFPVDALQPSA